MRQGPRRCFLWGPTFPGSTGLSLRCRLVERVEIVLPSSVSLQALAGIFALHLRVPELSCISVDAKMNADFI